MHGPDRATSTATATSAESGNEARLDAHRFVIAELGDRACHDLNNKLTIALGNLGLLTRRQQDAEERALAEDALQATRACANTVARMLAFSRAPELEPEETDLGDALAELEGTLSGLLGARGRLVLRLPERMNRRTRLDRRGFELTLTALTLFGAQRLDGSGIIEITLEPDGTDEALPLRVMLTVAPLADARRGDLDAPDPRHAPDLVLLTELARRSHGHADARVVGERMVFTLALPGQV